MVLSIEERTRRDKEKKASRRKVKLLNGHKETDYNPGAEMNPL